MPQQKERFKTGVSPNNPDAWARKQRLEAGRDCMNVCAVLEEKRTTCLHALQFLLALSGIKEAAGIKRARPTVAPLSRAGLLEYVRGHSDFYKDPRFEQVTKIVESTNVSLDDVIAFLETDDDRMMTEKIGTNGRIAS